MERADFTCYCFGLCLIKMDELSFMWAQRISPTVPKIYVIFLPDAFFYFKIQTTEDKSWTSSDKMPSPCFYSLLSLTLALQWKLYKKSLPKLTPQTCLKMQTSAARDNSTATELFSSIHSKCSKYWVTLFFLGGVGVGGSTRLGFCSFNTRHTPRYNHDLQLQKCTMSAQLLIHAEHVQNELVNRCRMS